MSPLIDQFVRHFGEMGSRWGINRTVGQIYALLFVSRQPLCADDLCDQLGMSRSNVSLGIKELQSWNLLRVSRLSGDRRDYFQAPEDVWTIFKTLAEERQRREVAPTLSMLRDAMLEDAETDEDRHAQERMTEMYRLIELLTEWFQEVNRLSPETLSQLMKLGSGVRKLLELRNRAGV